MSAQLPCLPPVSPRSVPQKFNMKEAVELLQNTNAPVDSNGVLRTGSFFRVGGATTITTFRNTPSIDHKLLFLCVNCHHVTNESSKSRHICKLNDNPKKLHEGEDVEEAESSKSDEEEGAGELAEEEEVEEKVDSVTEKKKGAARSTKMSKKKGHLARTGKSRSTGKRKRNGPAKRLIEG